MGDGQHRGDSIFDLEAYRRINQDESEGRNNKKKGGARQGFRKPRAYEVRLQFNNLVGAILRFQASQDLPAGGGREVGVLTLVLDADEVALVGSRLDRLYGNFAETGDGLPNVVNGREKARNRQPGSCGGSSASH